MKKLTKLMRLIMVAVIAVGIMIGFTACNEDEILETADFYFLEDETATPEKVTINTGDFRRDTSIAFVLKEAGYKYGFDATFDATGITLTSIKKLVPNSSQHIAIYTTILNDDVDTTITKKIGDTTFYYSNVGVANIKLQKDASYLFMLEEWQIGNVEWQQRLMDVGDYKNALFDPVIVGEYMYLLRGKNLLKLDTKTGTVQDHVEMDIAQNGQDFFYMQTLYVKDKNDKEMIICAYEGKIQAFDTDLKSLWIYENEKGGQANSPLVYDNNTNCIYTGFYSWDKTAEVDFVCVDISVENNTVEGEEVFKREKWTKTFEGGFNCTGAVIVGYKVVIGGKAKNTTEITKENGENKNTLYSLDKFTGDVVGSIEYDGDICSEIVYDLNSVFFTTTAGKFYRVWVSDANKNYFGTVRCMDTAYKVSQCAPTIYKNSYFTSGNRAYIFSHNGYGTTDGAMQVIDLDEWKEIYRVEIGGAVLKKPLIKEVYYNYKTEVYIYFTMNEAKGGMYYIVDGNGYKKSYKKTLFLPDGNSQGYCLSRIVADEQGAMYYRNDSGVLFKITHQKKQISG